MTHLRKISIWNFLCLLVYYVRVCEAETQQILKFADLARNNTRSLADSQTKNFDKPVHFRHNSIPRGPYCFACAGRGCDEPRIRLRDSDISCEVGDVCWTIETTELGPNPTTTYFRGCGRPYDQMCAGSRHNRSPARSTAGQRKDMNGLEYCEWGPRISQCKACCVTDFCNGARLFTTVKESKPQKLDNAVATNGGTISLKLIKGSQAESVLSGGFFVAFVSWLTLIAAFPP